MKRLSPAHYIDWNPELAREAVEDLLDQPGSMLEALIRIQQVFGYIDGEAIGLLSKMYNLSRAEVHGVVSFYHDLRANKAGRYTVKVCQAEACQAMGCEQLTEQIKDCLGIDFHETTTAGDFSLEPVYCVGNCACPPSIMINDRVFARMNIDKFKSLLREASDHRCGGEP